MRLAYPSFLTLIRHGPTLDLLRRANCIYWRPKCLTPESVSLSKGVKISQRGLRRWRVCGGLIGQGLSVVPEVSFSGVWGWGCVGCRGFIGWNSMLAVGRSGISGGRALLPGHMRGALMEVSEIRRACYTVERNPKF